VQFAAATISGPRFSRQVRIRPCADDLRQAFGLAGSCEQVVGTFQLDEAAWVTRGAENLAGVNDADGVVGWRMRHQKCAAQLPDLLVQIGGPDVLYEVTPQRQRFSADEERCLALLHDSLYECVVVVFDMGRLVGAPMLATARIPAVVWAAAITADPPKEWPTSSRAARPDSAMKCTAWTVSRTLREKDPSRQSPSDSPSPRSSKRSIPIPSPASCLQIRLAAGLSLPRVNP